MRYLALLLSLVLVAGTVWSGVYFKNMPNPSTEKYHIQQKNVGDLTLYFLQYRDFYVVGPDTHDIHVRGFDSSELSISSNKLDTNLLRVSNSTAKTLSNTKIESGLNKNDGRSSKVDSEEDNEYLEEQFEFLKATAKDDSESEMYYKANPYEFEKYSTTTTPHYFIKWPGYLYFYKYFCFTDEVVLNHRFYQSGNITYHFTGQDVIALNAKKSRFDFRSCSGNIKIEYSTNNDSSWKLLDLNKYVLFDPTGDVYVRVSFSGNGLTTPLMLEDVPLEFVDKSMQVTGTLTPTQNVVTFDALNYVPDDYDAFVEQFLQYISINILDGGPFSCQKNGTNFVCTIGALVDENVQGTIDLSLVINFSGTNLEIPFFIPYDLRNLFIDLNPVEFSLSNVSINVDEGSTLNYNLAQHIVDEDDAIGAYALSITTNPSVATCVIQNQDYLNCNIPSSFVSDSLVVQLHDVHHNVNSTLNVSLVSNDANPVQFNTEVISVNANEGSNVNVEILPYLYDADAILGEYHLSITNDSDVLDCSLDNTTLECNVPTTTQTTDSLQLEVFDISLEQRDYLNVNFNIILNNRPPEILMTLGNKTMIGTDKSVTYSIASLVKDDDNPISSLIFTYNLVSDVGLNASDFSCVKQSTNVVCSFANANIIGDAEVKLKFTDPLGAYAETNSFHLNHVSLAELPSLVVPGAIHDVYNGANFDYTITLANNLGFDLYNIALSLDTSLPLQYNNTINLTNESSEEINLDVTMPLEPNTQVTNYNLFVKTNNNTIQKFLAGESSTFLSVPLKKEFVEDYLDVLTWVPGVSSNGKNNFLPLDTKAVIPYRIINSFDIPVTLYVCKIPTAFSMDVPYVHIYNSENTDQEMPNGNYCEQKELISGQTDDTLIFSNTSPDASILATLFLDTVNPNLPSALRTAYVNYKNSSETFLLEKYSTNLYFDSFVAAGAIITNPAAGTTLNKNTTYNLDVTFANNYAFPLADVNACGTVWYNSDGQSLQVSTNNDYLQMLGTPCTTLNLNYYNTDPLLRPVDYQSQQTFSFKTKNLSINSTGWPRTGVGGSYVLEGSFVQKGASKLNIQ